MGKVLVEIFSLVTDPVTRVWLSEQASAELEKFCKKGDPDGRFLRSLARASQSGFAMLENTRPPKLKPEWDGVSRIGFDFSLFRLIGFYEDPSTKSDYIIIEAFLKRGQKLGQTERDAIDRVAQVRRDQLWLKKDPNE